MTETVGADITGWGRSDVAQLLARLTDGFVRAIPPGGSPAGAALPGHARDRSVAAIEGFARMSVAWGAWLHEPSNGPLTYRRGGLDARRDDLGTHDLATHDVARLVALGFADGTDERHPAYWGPIGDRDQRIVEAAEVATALMLGGPPLRHALDAVDPGAMDRVLDWLALVDGRDVWPDNWVLFPMLSALARRMAGRRLPDAAIDDPVDWMSARADGDGWYRDGDGTALDLYTGWAIHWHLLWWATSPDASRRPARRDAIVRRARTWLVSAAAMVSRDGSYPRFGRSLGYRFAFAAPFAQAALLGIDPLPRGVARRLVTGVARRAVSDGAIDPATDWFRVGVGEERPTVVEPYVSTGASAWAAHAFVALAMPADHPFWSHAERPLPTDGPKPDRLATRAAGWLVAWDRSGSTRLFNARSGHPSDIPDHDYAATYGKLVYRSAFPVDVPVVPGASAGGEDTLLLLGDGRPAHRNESIAGRSGPRWIRTRYVLAAADRIARVTTTVLALDDLEIVVSRVTPAERVRFRAGGPALGLDGGEVAAAHVDEATATAAATDGTRVVAIRGLLGFSAVGTTGSGDGRANLVHDHSVHPFVEERVASRNARTLVWATLGSPGSSSDALAALAEVRADEGVDGRIALKSRCWSASVAPGSAARSVVRLRGVTFRGPAVTVAFLSDDAAEIAAEGVAGVDHVVRLATPGAVSIRREGRTVLATAESGMTLDPSWTGTDLTHVRSRVGIGDWEEATPLERPNVVPNALVRRLKRHHGTALVSLELESA